jgi:uncharacterized protein
VAEKVQRALLPLGRSGAALLALLLVAPAGVTLALRATPRLDLIFESPGFHVVVVSAIAACALIVALLTAVVASRAPQPATVLVACGCLFVGVMMLGHGLTTPGVFGRPLNMWVARFPVLALAGFAGPLVVAGWAVWRHVPAGHRRAFWRRVWHPGGISARWGVASGVGGLAASRAAAVAAAAFAAPPAVMLRGAVGAALFGLVAGLVEEPGWRGAVLDRFPEQDRGLRAALVIGVAWAVWHLPLYAVEGTFHHGLGLGSASSFAILLGPVPWSVLLVWLVNSTKGRILPAVVAHALGNLGGDLLTPTAGTRLIGLGALTALALVVVWATRGSLTAWSYSER